MTNLRKKVCIVATVPFALKVFMRPHILMLAEEVDVTLITRGKEADLHTLLGEHVRFKNLNIVRKTALFSDLYALIALYLIFRKNRFDVVHSIMPKTGLLAMLAAYVAHVPHRIHTFTGQVWANKMGWTKWGLMTLDKIISFCATGLMADSFSQRAFLIEQNVVPERKIVVLGSGSICGVDVLRFQCNSQIKKIRRAELGISDNAVVFLFLGRLN
ncbi:MAG: glycosyltransferase, group 1 family, partial [Solimicrobium sp.]|nr:glycosyltransferase, group 1 family [Solimicrobium sp.]